MRNLFFVLFLGFTLVPESQGSPDNILFRVLPEGQSLEKFGTPSRRELDRSVKALVWNIKKASLVPWANEFETYAADRDVVLLQEAYRTSIFNTSLGRLPMSWNLGISFLYKRYMNTPTGSLVGSTAEASLSYVKHSPDDEPVTDTPKAVTFAKYPIKDRFEELLVVSVHAINFNSNPAFRRQMDQVFAEMKDHAGPILLAGDFNTWNAGRTQYLRFLSEQLGLKEVALKNGTYRTTFRGWFLDHVFIRGATVRSAAVITNSVGSDHRPIQLEFDLH
jgi:endonuclease/exonuclease/phosphatase (EEP) superfamily protein YafD